MDWQNIRSHFYLIPVMSLIIVIIACEDASISGIDDSPYPDLGYTTADSTEAIQMAWYWDRRMTPTDSTRDYLLYHMKLLRLAWEDTLPFIADQRFLLPWMPGIAQIRFDSTTAQEVRNGTYTGFSTLPEFYQPDSLNISDQTNWATAYFEANLHPVVMCQYFEELPGVSRAVPNPLIFLGGDLPLFFGWVDTAFAVLFNENPMLIPTAHYFKVVAGAPVYFGNEWDESDSLIQAEMSAIRNTFMEKLEP